MSLLALPFPQQVIWYKVIPKIEHPITAATALVMRQACSWPTISLLLHAGPKLYKLIKPCCGWQPKAACVSCGHVMKAECVRPLAEARHVCAC